MKNFKNPKLYDNEIGPFKAVIKNKIQTLTEYNETGRYVVGNEEENEDQMELDRSLEDAFSSNWEDSFDIGGSSGGFSGFGMGELDESLPSVEYNDIQPHYFRVLTSPITSLKYFYKGMIHDNPFTDPNKIEEKDDGSPSFSFQEEKISNKHSAVLTSFTYTGVLVLFLGLLSYFPYLRTLISPLAGVIGFLFGIFADYLNGKYYDEGYILKYINLEDDEEMEDIDDELDKEQEIHLENKYEDKNNDDLDDFFKDFDDEETFDSLVNTYGEMEEDEFYDEDDPEGAYGEQETIIKEMYPPSPIQVSSVAEFNQTLLDTFQELGKYKGVIHRKRADILRTFAPLMPTNDSSFSNWYDIREHSAEYDNIAYTIYKALASINNRFDISENTKDVLTIHSMKRTKLIYKIEISVPKYFKDDVIKRNKKTFDNMLKATDDDTQVGTLITSFDGHFIIKFLRLDQRGLISNGDIMRYYDPEKESGPVMEMAEDKGVPVLVGLRDNEYPYIFDLEANTSGAIVGGSGSGKSWLTFQLMTSIFTSNTPEELNVLILDAKDANYWKQLSGSPHVIGYHSDYTKFLDLLQEVNKEHLRRMSYLSSQGIEDWKGLRAKLKREQRWDDLAENPFLIVVIDEITFTMTQLQSKDKEMYDAVKAALISLSAVVRASGIRLMLIGQRATEPSIPKSYMSNASMRFAMKMDEVSDFEKMLGKKYHTEVSRVPVGPGEGLMKVQGQDGSSYIKTLAPGGTDDDQLTKILRVLGLEWTRRTIGTKDYTTLPKGMKDSFELSFNRTDRYLKSLQDLKTGRILEQTQINDGYQQNIEPGQTSDTSTKFGVSKQTEVFGKDDEILDLKKELLNDFDNFNFEDTKEPDDFTIEIEDPSENPFLNLEQEEIEFDYNEIDQEEIESDIEEINYDETLFELDEEVNNSTEKKVVVENENTIENTKIENFEEVTKDSQKYSKEITKDDYIQEIEEDDSMTLDDLLNMEVPDKETLETTKENITETLPEHPDNKFPEIKEPEVKEQEINVPETNVPEIQEQEVIKKPNPTQRKRLKPKGIIQKPIRTQKETQEVKPKKLNIPLKEYIKQHGVKLDNFTVAIEKSVIDDLYTKKDIKLALAVGDIYGTVDSYVTSLI